MIWKLDRPGQTVKGLAGSMSELEARGLASMRMAGILFTPVLHRFLHRFHLETGERSANCAKAGQ